MSRSCIGPRIESARRTLVLVLFTTALVPGPVPGTAASAGIAVSAAGEGASSSPTAADSTRPSGGAAAAWSEAEGLQVAMGDSLDPRAHVFDSPDYQTQLVIPGSGEVFLLALKAQTVRVLPRRVLRWPGNSLVPRLEAGRDGGSFESHDGILAFRANGTLWKVEPEPPLVGPVPLEKLREEMPQYVYAASRYVPDRDAVASLHQLATETDLVIFFGSWCNYCRHWLPRMLKTLEAAANPEIKPEFIGVAASGGEPKAELARYRVTETPTFIVLQNGREIGRIENLPWKESIEARLAGIVRGH